MGARRIVPVVVLVVAILLGAWWWRSRESGPTRGDGSTHGAAAEATAAIASLHRQAGFTADRALPGWFVRAGAKPRRIAGKVTRDKQPAAGVTVTLQSMLTHTGLGAAVDVKAGADGRFDFGAWPAGEYTVSASAPR